MKFADLKKQSNSNNIDKLVNELQKTTKSYVDDRFWSCAIDEKTGNGTAVIRFLPSSHNNPLPWVTYYHHSFQGPGGWYIENSRTTLGEADPVTEVNTELWNTGIESNKELVRKRKRKQSYVSNILVLEDPKNPSNEGKVFLFRYGKKIFGKIQEKLQPEFDGDKAIDVFDFWKGSNLKLKIKKVEGYPNYDSSLFETQTPVLDGDDKKLEALWNTQYDLSEFIKPSNFKSYDDLKKRMDRVLGNKPASAGPEMAPPSGPSLSLDEDNSLTPPWRSESKSNSFSLTEDEDDDALKYFEGLKDR